MHFVRTLFVPIIAAWLLGCAGQVSDASPEAVGSLSLSLSQTADDGDIYRLRDAVLAISGSAAQRHETSESDETFATALPPGEYALSLEPGWQLMRTRDGVTEPVEATLVSDNPQPFSILRDSTTRLGLRFSVEAGPVDLGEGSLEVALQVEVRGPELPTCEPRLVVNEIDYDQEGADEREFVEIYNASLCEVVTAGLSLSLYNGGTADGVPVAYATTALDAVVDRIPAGGLLVVGDSAVLADLAPGVLGVELSGGALQNGVPDGVALELGGAILDAVSYGGALPGVGEGEAAPVDPGAGALGRCPDGVDSGDNAADFTLLDGATPGARNAC